MASRGPAFGLRALAPIKPCWEKNMTKNLVHLLVPALFAAGCASMMAGGGKSAPCNTHICKVEVTVDDACRIAVDPTDLPVAAGNKEAVIQWDIQGGEFAANGIAFKQDPGNEFHSPSHSPKRITFVDRHSRVGVIYPYSVSVVRGGKACAPLDPTIMN